MDQNKWMRTENQEIKRERSALAENDVNKWVTILERNVKQIRKLTCEDLISTECSYWDVYQEGLYLDRNITHHRSQLQEKKVFS